MKLILLQKDNQQTMITFETKKELKKIKYGDIDKNFYNVLKERVDAYFERTNQTRFANWEMHIKTILLLVLMCGSYALIISNRVADFAIIPLQIFFHIISFVMWIGIAHDAHHDAYTPNRTFNKFLLFLGDITGVSSFLMDYNHVKAHHTSVNIPDHDVSIDSFGIMRFHPSVTWKPIHRYQHIYIWVLYCISSIFKLFIFDFFSLNRKSIGSFKVMGLRWYHFIYMIVMKSFAIFYSVILPIMLIDTAPWIIITGFVVGHMLSGAVLGLVFQVTHLCDYSLFTEPDADEKLKNSFAIHVLENTSTFSPKSYFMTWFTGGLNHHTIHHVFPTICQSHFIHLTPILRETAKEYGVPFKEYPTFWEALKSHYYMLKKLGESPAYKSVPFSDYQLHPRYQNIYA